MEREGRKLERWRKKKERKRNDHGGGDSVIWFLLRRYISEQKSDTQNLFIFNKIDSIK